MNVNNNKENLISINEVIKRAKKLGVAFGSGDPKNRLRYYVKIGLIPHAKRKVFKNNFPEGAYPKEIVWKLYEIDKRIKSRKSVRQIKREMEVGEEGFKEKVVALPKVGEGVVEKRFKPRFISASKIFFVVLLSVLVFYFLYPFNALNAIDTTKLNFKNLTSSFLANLSMETGDFTQPSVIPAKPLERKSFKFSETDPYLTINAETAIKGKLNVRDSVSASSFTITTEPFKANLVAGSLSADRTYTFPDQSGVVCLSTGNCVGLGGEVVSSGGTTNRLTKFVAPNEIGNSSIADTYEGVAITISPAGNVGIGTNSPKGKLDVSGKILAKDLSVANNAKIGNNLFVANNLGIGEENSKYPLYVKGKIQATGDICTDLKGGKCLSQLSASAPVFFGGGGIGGSGTAGYLALWRNSGSLTNSIVSQSGSTLTVAGNGLFKGPITISASTFPQLILQYGSDDYLKFSISSTSSAILASKTMSLNSLTGEIKFFDTSFKKGDKILRASIPIFKFPLAAQTTSTEFVSTTREISPDDLDSVLPAQFSGSQRKFALLINFADDIPISASSTWRIDFATQPDIDDIDFEFKGQNLSSLDEGVSHLKDNLAGLLNDNWVLKVKIPSSSNRIRIFNIFLLAFDQIQ